MTPHESQSELCILRTEQLRLLQKAIDRRHAAGIARHTRKAAALAEGILAIERQTEGASCKCNPTTHSQ